MEDEGLGPTTARWLRGAKPGREAWLFPVIIVAAAYDPLTSLGHISLGSVGIEPTDVAIAVALIAALVFLLRDDRKTQVRPEHVLVAGIIALFVCPVFIGVADGHSWQSSVYGARVAFAQLLFFAGCVLVPNHKAGARVLGVVLLTALVGAAYGVLARAMGWEWDNSMSVVATGSGSVLSRGYGWWSAMPWYAYGSVVAVALALLGTMSSRLRWAAWLGAAFLAASTVSTLIRGDLLGLVIGAASLGAFAVVVSKRGSVLRRRVKFSVAVAAGLLIVALAVGVAVRPSVVSAVGERTLSIFVPQAASAMAQHTRGDRIEAAVYGLTEAQRYPFGSGYGTFTADPDLRESRSRYFATHSGVAWIGIYLGFVGGVTLLCAACLLAALALRNALRVGQRTWVVACAIAVLAAMLAQSLAASVLFADHYTYPLAPILLALALCPLVIETGKVPAPC